MYFNNFPDYILTSSILFYLRRKMISLRIHLIGVYDQSYLKKNIIHIEVIYEISQIILPKNVFTVDIFKQIKKKEIKINLIFVINVENQCTVKPV